jgi:type I restriction enzyme, S subunit
VTTRGARGREGFKDSWMEEARVQVVKPGDLVIHGLDGFSGAIGDAEVGGVCSPVYHVCHAIEGDTAFLGRMLRLLALQGYLTNFAVSTRERAVDFRNWDLFGRIPIPMPSPSEQRRIGDEIRALRPLAQAIAKTQVLAAERRRSLITAAVTGEMEVA